MIGTWKQHFWKPEEIEAAVPKATISDIERNVCTFDIPRGYRWRLVVKKPFLRIFGEKKMLLEYEAVYCNESEGSRTHRFGNDVRVLVDGSTGKFHGFAVRYGVPLGFVMECLKAREKSSKWYDDNCYRYSKMHSGIWGREYLYEWVSNSRLNRFLMRGALKKIEEEASAGLLEYGYCDVDGRLLEL